MSQYDLYDLFISYSHRDTTAAENIAKQATQRGLSYFLAKKEVEPGERWDEKIRRALLGSRELCVLVTPASIESEWVTFEWNVAWLLNKRLTPILKGVDADDLLKRIDARKLAKRLLDYQAADYYMVEEFLDRVFERKSADPLLLYNQFKLNNLVRETLFAPSIEGSPFVFSELVKLAHARIFLAGQNLFTLIVKYEKKNKDLLFEFLAQDETRSIDIMLCDPSYDAEVQTWQRMTASMEYPGDLAKSIARVEQWTMEAKQRKLRLRARKVPIVPVSITFIDPDPDGKKGLLFLVPNVYQANPGEKSCFFMDRALHTTAFNYYWNNYETTFSRGVPIGQSE